jgi:hypothetical protein
VTTVRLSYAKGTGHTTSVYRVRAKQGRYFMPPRTRAEDANDIAVEYFFERIVCPVGVCADGVWGFVVTPYAHTGSAIQP